MKRLLLILLLLLSLPAAAQRTVYPLNDAWFFALRHENSSDAARGVTLPHTWNGDALAGDAAYLRTTGDYLRRLYLPAEWQGRRLFLKFYGAQSEAQLFVNGRYAGEHRGAGVAFTLEITPLVKFGAENRLRVAVSNAPQSDLLPLSSLHNLYGGLTRPVELIITDATAISPLHYGTEGVLVHPLRVTAERAEGEVEVHLTSNREANGELTVELLSPEGKSVFRRTQRVKIDGRAVRIPFALEHPRRWSPEDPALYTVRAAIQGAETHDEVTLHTGFRRVEVVAGEGFRLNDSLCKVRGVVLYYDRPTVGDAASEEELREDFALLEEVGANALRSPAGPHPDLLYDLCDSAGVVAWIDLPLLRTPFLSDMAYLPSPQFEQQGRELLREIILQHQNHPSVVMWGLFDGLTMRGDDPTRYIGELNKLAHELDPSRPTVATSDQDGTINFVSDLIVWRPQLGWGRGRTEDIAVWAAQLQTNWSELRSAISYGAEGVAGHTGTNDRAGRAHWSETAQRRFHEDYTRHLPQDSVLWGVWIHTLSDFGSARRPLGIEPTGLVSFDRRTRKDAFYLYRAQWNRRQPTLHIADRATLSRRSEGVTIYSSEGRPLVLSGSDTLHVTQYAPCVWRLDSVRLDTLRELRIEAGTLRERITLGEGSPLTPPPTPALRQRGGLQWRD